MFKHMPMRGFKFDPERSRNLDGTVPTKEAHYWIEHPVPQLGACTAHAACGDRMVDYDADRRLLNESGKTPLCPECADWAAQRIAAGHEFEREAA